VVIDPRRDIDVYRGLADKNGIRIRYIFETHRNEDIVSGSVELSQATGAEIYHGPGLQWGYGSTLKDGQEFQIGNLNFKAIATPGHTDESTSFILVDRNTGDNPIIVFSGDTLFIGDTGRIDLYGPGESERLAALLWDSIHHRLLPLGDSVILCPAHGSGSVCGVSIADRDDSTLGLERLQNPALQIRDRDQFISKKLSERPEKPPYFARMEQYNLSGPPLIGSLSLPAALIPGDFQKEIEKGAVVVDTSMPAAFGGAHIKGSYDIWLDGLAHFGGWFLPYDKPILLVLEDQNQLEKAVRYLLRIGYDNVRGYLKGGIEGWYNAGLPIEKLPLLSVFELKEKLDRREDLLVLDVRKQDEWISGHIKGAMHVFVGEIQQRLNEIPQDKPLAVHCTVGRRSGIAASVLLRAGYKNVYNVLGSITAWKHAGFPVTKE
jgi:hydroxyacylglutathione hydrolase